MHAVEFDLDGLTIRLETGQLATRAHGAVMVRCGLAAALATVVRAPGEPGLDYLPLAVDYRERQAAAGRIPGNYLRRETRQAEHEILISRLIDRSARPLFAGDLTDRVQVTVTLYSDDPSVDRATLALLAAGAALHISPLPFAGPLAGARVTRTENGTLTLARGGDGQYAQDLLLSGTEAGLVMVEGFAALVADAALIETVDHTVSALAPALDAMQHLRAAVGLGAREAQALKRDAAPPAPDAAIAEALRAPTRAARQAALAALPQAAEPGFAARVAQTLRAELHAGRRPGGRRPDQVRPIDAVCGVLPSNHGSAVFTRGDTQALVSATIGSQRDGQDLETLDGHTRRRFLLHYNFPAFSVGEVGPNRGPGRRELGHGELARRALRPALPSRSEYAYPLRVVSDILSADGSSSMATVCGATLALRHAGVPLRADIAGVAMGALRRGSDWLILTDISGDEDHQGDLDFKVTGTADAVSAFQLDNKAGAVPLAVLTEALAAAQVARAHILAEMGPALTAAVEAPSDHAPRTRTVHVPSDRVGALIGTGGKHLQSIQSKTGTRLDVSDDGTVVIQGPDDEALAAAARLVSAVSLELRKGGVYRGEVTQTKDFGAFVRVGPHEALVHKSELVASGSPDPATVVSPGDAVTVRVLGADSRGRLKLSIKAALGADPSEILNDGPEASAP